MKELLPYAPWILLFVAVTILIESLYSIYKKKPVHDPKDTAANVFIIVGYQVFKAASLTWQIYILNIFYDMTPLRLPNSTSTFFLSLLIADFLYYWYHRWMHGYKPLWAFHLIHHSSQKLNLTTSFRLNWLSPIISAFFFIPAALVGIPPATIVLSYAVNLLYQYWLHTEFIGKIPVIEGILNTPSGHRVHHGSNPIYIDKNYGGILMIWDRMFGTYQPETEKVRYGITYGFVSYNPFILLLHGFYDLFRGKMNYKG